MEWKKEAQELFNRVISCLPQFHQTIAKTLVKESAETGTREKSKEFVDEEEVIEAFFREVPPAFRSMMERLFKNLGIDYERYLKKR